MVSVAIERECGLETIPHVTTRDTTVLGLESTLLGAHAEGVRNVLRSPAIRPRSATTRARAACTRSTRSASPRVISRLNAGEDFNGRPIDAPTSFFVGVAVNPTADDLELEADRFAQKLEAGAQFAMTQIVFDLAVPRPLLERLGGWPIPVLVGIFPVTSHRLALRLHNEVPGIVVPEPVQERLRVAGKEAPAVGRELAKELIEGSRALAAGVYVIPPFRRPEAALELL